MSFLIDRLRSFDEVWASEAADEIERLRTDYSQSLQRRYTLEREIERLRAALVCIEKWFGEFPPSERSWESGEPMSYGAAFGSNGERDYMRAIARRALEGK